MDKIKLIGVLLLTAVFFVAVHMVFGTKEATETKVNVYFAKFVSDEKTAIVSVQRNVDSNANIVESSLIELLKGPLPVEREQGFYTEIPFDTELIKISQSPERVVIDLSQSFEAGGGSSSMITRLEQVKKTIKDTPETRPVYLAINGEEVSYIGGEGIEVPRPFVERRIEKQ